MKFGQTLFLNLNEGLVMSLDPWIIVGSHRVCLSLVVLSQQTDQDQQHQVPQETQHRQGLQHCSNKLMVSTTFLPQRHYKNFHKRLIYLQYSLSYLLCNTI